jgi:hypothetical protein
MPRTALFQLAVQHGLPLERGTLMSRDELVDALATTEPVAPEKADAFDFGSRGGENATAPSRRTSQDRK